MANDHAQQILQQGIAAARAGQQAQARQLLQQVVKLDPKNETAWLWLSSVAADDKERIFCLKQLLAINPRNDNAIKGLRQLGVQVDAPPPTIKPLRPSSTGMGARPSSGRMQTPVQPSRPSSGQMQTPFEQPRSSGSMVTPGTPLIDEQRINATMAQLDPILQRHQTAPTTDLPFEWTKKRRGRVGDASALILQAGVFGGGAVLLIAIVAVIFLVFSRGGPVGLALAPTATATPVPTNTFTPTPGATDTPSPTPRITQVPFPTPGDKIKAGDPYNPQPTPLYPPVASSKIVREALTQASQGNRDEAIKKLEGELNALSTAKNDDYYAILYYLTDLYIAAGNPERAQTMLNDNKANTPAYHAALANVLYALKDFDGAFREADAALKVDKNLASAAIIESEILTVRGSFTDARRILNFALEGDQAQRGNTDLYAARGRVSLQEGNYRDAEADAVLALYIDPLNRSAYILRIQTLLAKARDITEPDARIQAFGSAVLASKDFLLWYPSDITAWRLLAESRQGEGNIDAALNAYAQAAVSKENKEELQQVYLARGRLFMTLHRYQEAYDDFDQALLVGELAEARRGRLDAALALHDAPKTADNDVAELRKTSPDDPSLILIQANLLVRDQKFDQLGALVPDKFVDGLDNTKKPEALLYRGIAKFTNASNKDKAPGLDDISASLAAKESGLGHYYRGQIYEAAGQLDNALVDYQWVLYWSSLYNYDFASDVQKRLEAVQNAVPAATATNTQRPTATEIPSKTPIPSRTPTPSRTPRGSMTPTESSATDTPTASPTAEATETNTPTATLTATATATKKR